MIRLVVNADDLGLHPRLDEGILRAHADGIVTSTSLLVTGRTAEKAARAAKAAGLGIGVHLCLSSHLTPAAPAREVRWLAPGSRFRKSWKDLTLAWFGGLVPVDEVRREFRAQVERARQLGVDVDHLDTHQHLHLLPGITALVEELALELRVPVRWPADRPRRSWLRSPARAAKAALLGSLGRLKPAVGVQRVRAHGVFESGVLTEARLLRLVRGLEDGDHEIMCHPGLSPGVIPEEPDWRYGWEAELGAVCSERARAAVQERGAALLTYGALARSAGARG